MNLEFLEPQREVRRSDHNSLWCREDSSASFRQLLLFQCFILSTSAGPLLVVDGAPWGCSALSCTPFSFIHSRTFFVGGWDVGASIILRKSKAGRGGFHSWADKVAGRKKQPECQRLTEIKSLYKYSYKVLYFEMHICRRPSLASLIKSMWEVQCQLQGLD